MSKQLSFTLRNYHRAIHFPFSKNANGMHAEWHFCGKSMHAFGSLLQVRNRIADSIHSCRLLNKYNSHHNNIIIRKVNNE